MQLLVPLERELQPELNEPRITECGGHNPEVGRHLSGIRGGKLRVVEQVEELRAELHVHAFARPEVRSFEDCEVKVIHALLPKRCIHT